MRLYDEDSAPHEWGGLISIYHLNGNGILFYGSGHPRQFESEAFTARSVEREILSR